MADTIIIKPQKGKQELALNIEVDVLIYGGAAGSGKSRLLLMKPLAFMDDPNFECVFFRRTTKALDKAGSLWPEGKKLYRPFNPKIRQQAHQIIFDSGATITMDHLEHNELTAEANHQGTQYSAVFFDELTHFSQEAFLYMIGRLRSASEADSFCMASCNPDFDSWVLNWVEWYLDESGTPDPDKCGTIRYFVTVDERPVFADTREELIEAYPDLCYQKDNDGNEVLVPPQSFAFIGGTIFDNPALIKANPGYLASLKAQTAVNRARLLDGNWYARPEGSGYFLRSWLNKVDKPPNGITVRAWDKASSEPSDVERFPDFTASVKMIKSRDGRYCIVGDYHPENEDRHGPYKGKFREKPGARDTLMVKQALHDKKHCVVILPVDPGQAGKTEFQESAKKFIEHGIPVKADPAPSNKSKLTKFSPFSSACELGLVDIVESSFPDAQTLNQFYKELEAFDGERSTRQRKDDIPDACASAFNTLAESRGAPIVIRNQQSAPTLAQNIRNDLKGV